MKTIAWTATLVVSMTALGCSQPGMPAGQPRTDVAMATVAAAAPAPAAPSPAPIAAAAALTAAAPTGAPIAPTAKLVAHAPLALAAGELHVKRFVVATAVKDHEPQGASTLFRKNDVDKLYAFIEVENQAKNPGEIVVSFESPDGRTETGDVHLAVGSSPRWRTWAFTRGAHEIGSWTAVVRDQDGRTLARTPFEIAL